MTDKTNRLRSRQELASMFADRCFAVGAEIGVYKGAFSKTILLSNPQLEVLYSIDPWTDISGNFVKSLYDECCGCLSQFGSRSRIVVGSSPAEAEMFEDLSLDFVYIDADHLYLSAAKDLVAWWPKIKRNGIMSGHDYKDCCKAERSNLSQPGECGVRRAVDEFALGLGLEVQVTWERCRSFWIVKL